MIEIRLLRYFLAIVDAGSVTKASSVVRVAQPSVSRQVRQLEQSLGVDLFDRSRGRLRLTAAGRALVPMARDLIMRAETAANVVRGMAENQAISLSVIAPETTVADVLAPFLASRGSKALQVTVREALPNAVFGAVIAGEADLGISSGPASGELTVRPLLRFPIYAYAPPEHPLARSRSIRLDVLAQEPLILLEEPHGTRRLFDDAISHAGLAYHCVASTNVPQVAQAFAAAGRGFAVVTDDRRYGLRPLSIETSTGQLTITLFAGWDDTHYAAPMILELVDELAAFLLRRYGPDSRP